MRKATNPILAIIPIGTVAIFMLFVAGHTFFSRRPIFVWSQSSWRKEVAKASWMERDAASAIIFKDRVWIFGGWLHPYLPSPRDAWSSDDGKSWRLEIEKSPWHNTYFSMATSFQNRMWMMGGWYHNRLSDASASNEIWSSENGRTWERVSQHASWSPRLGGALVEFKGQLWLLGGAENISGDASKLLNDVWHSNDGKNWTLATSSAPWAPRAYHSATVHDGKIYVLGGGNWAKDIILRNDVWSSDDGIHWNLVTEAAPWAPRMWSGAVSYRNNLWVIGGFSEGEINLNDVWHSTDGSSWEKLDSGAVFPPRHAHNTFVFKDRIWVMAGLDGSLYNDVWSLQLPDDWLPQGRGRSLEKLISAALH